MSLILRGRTQYFMLGDRRFGHLSVIKCLPDEDMRWILSRDELRFSLLLQNTPAQQNVVSLLSRKPIA